MGLRLGVLLIGGLLVPPSPGPGERPVLRVGMDTRSRPWTWVPGLDYSKEDFQQKPRITPAQIEQLQGLDMDFVRALAGELHMVPKIVPQAWAHIEEGLVSKEYDVLINAWVPNTKTPASIRRSSPYCEWGLVVAVKADNKAVQSFEDLAGRKVGYFSDPVVLRSVETLQASSLVPFDDSDQLFEALGKGLIDAAVEDSNYVGWRVAHDPTFREAGRALNKLSYYVGTRVDDTELYDKVERAIRDLVESGQTEKIRIRWSTATDTPGR